MKRTTTLAGLVLVSLAAPFACTTSPGGPELHELGIFVANPGGTPRSVACVQLPVLEGSQVDDTTSVDGEFDVRVAATRAGADVRFVAGTTELDTLFVSVDDLSTTYAHELTLSPPGTDEYTMRLTSDCGSSAKGTGGTGGNGASTGGRSATGGGFSSGGAGGVGGTPAPLAVSKMTPDGGPYGTEITLTGTSFGTKAASKVTLSLGDDAAFSVAPASTVVTSWTDSEIRFRFPFPVEGAVTLKGEDGDVTAGDFTPTWKAGTDQVLAGSAKAITSIAPSAGRLLTILDTSPPTLLENDGDTWKKTALTLTGVRTDTLRLYLAGGKVHGFALSSDNPPKIVALEPGATTSDLVATVTPVAVTTVVALAAGPAGATVWFANGNEWRRARPTAGVWSVDKGPVQDPNPSGTNHAVAAGSDGSFHVFWSQDTGSLFDDTGTPYIQSLAATATAFASYVPAGVSVDDFVTSVAVESRGDGLVLQYCGSNVDPFGLSATGYSCRLSLITVDGTRVDASSEDANSRYLFRGKSVGGVRCTDPGGTEVVADLAAATGAGTPSDAGAPPTATDIAVWPCVPVVAAEFDTDGVPQFIVRNGSSLYSPRPR
jgi:hypothetical protein